MNFWPSPKKVEPSRPCDLLSRQLKEHVKHCSNCYVSEDFRVYLCTLGRDMQQAERKASL